MGAQIPIILLIVAAFSLIVNGAIPFALGLVPQRWAGLGIGMYFGGFTLAMSLFGVLFPQPQAIRDFQEINYPKKRTTEAQRTQREKK
ncbi:MAG: hypothetical protein V7K41_17590 [Nostoc sp.]